MLRRFTRNDELLSFYIQQTSRELRDVENQFKKRIADSNKLLPRLAAILDLLAVRYKLRLLKQSKITGEQVYGQFLELNKLIHSAKLKRILTHLREDELYAQIRRDACQRATIAFLTLKRNLFVKWDRFLVAYMAKYIWKMRRCFNTK